MRITGSEITMEDAVEGGASLAWRLLATLEGGSLILATSALLAYTARARITKKRKRHNVSSVLITNTRNPLGKELKKQLEAHGCVVSTLQEGATSGAGAVAEASKVDALVVVGAEPTAVGLDRLAELVSEDVYVNMKLLDAQSPRVRRGGRMAWACAGATSGAFGAAAAAFDAALQAALQHAAKSSHCEPIWVGRCEDAERAAEKIVAALMPCTTQHDSMFSIRNAANKVSGYIGRWFKIVT